MSFTKRTVQGVTFHTCDAFTAAGGVSHGFATRLGGVSQAPFDSLNLGVKRPDQGESVRENYRRFCAALGAAPEELVMTHQVHSDDVRQAGREDILDDLLDPIPYETDGLVTDQPGLCLTIYYADCIPVLLYDPVKKAIGAVHSGWRGTAKGIAVKAAQKMEALYGSRMADILVAIGPGIGPCCFETHDDVPAAMAASLGPGAAPYCKTLDHGKFSVDLKAILRWQLGQAGIAPDHIHDLGICTACRPDLYWSHRKMGEARGNHAAMLRLIP